MLTLATFPGIIVHEIAHVIFCRLLGVRVLKVSYLRLGREAGYVVHEQPASVLQDILIGTGPMLVNTFTGAVVGLPGAMALRRGEFGSATEYVLLWLGVSIAMHSFPSTGDARSIWQAVWSRQSGVVSRAAALPIVMLIYLGALGSVFWLDLLYGAAVVMLFPEVLVRCAAIGF